MTVVAEDLSYTASGIHENRIPAGTEEAQLQRLEALAKEALQSRTPHLQPELVSSAEGRKECKDILLKQIGVLGVLLEELRALQRVPDLFFPQRLRQRSQKLESELMRRETEVHAQLVSFASEQENFAAFAGKGHDDAGELVMLKEPCLLHQNLTKDLGILESDSEVAIAALWKDMRALRDETRAFAEVEAAHTAAAIHRQKAGPAPSSVLVDQGERPRSGNPSVEQAREEVDAMEHALAEARKQAQCFEGANRCEECLFKVQHGLQQVRPRAEASTLALVSSRKAMDSMDAEIQKLNQEIKVAKSQLQVGLVSEWETIMGRTRETSKWAGLLRDTAQHAEARFVELNENRRKLNQRLVHTKKDLDQFVNHAHLLRRNPSAANF